MHFHMKNSRHENLYLGLAEGGIRLYHHVDTIHVTVCFREARRDVTDTWKHPRRLFRLDIASPTHRHRPTPLACESSPAGALLLGGVVH